MIRSFIEQKLLCIVSSFL